MKEVKNFTDNPVQKRIILSASENLLVAGGVGAGKSYAILYKIREIMLREPGIIWVIGRTTLKDLKSDTYEICFGEPGFFRGLGTMNKTDHEFIMYNGSKIWFKHLDDPDALRGPSIGGVFFEQAELIKEDVFSTMTARLRQWGNLNNKTSLGYRYIQKYGKSPNHIHVPKHYFYLVANPHPGSWIKKKFIDKENPNWEVILTTSYDNQKNLRQNYIERLKEEHNELWVQRYIYGSWEQAEGLVYPEFEEDNIIDPIGTIHVNEKIYIGIDPGFQHASTAAFCLIRDEKLIVFDEVYERGKTVSEVAAIINLKLKDRFRSFLSKYDITFLIDPSSNRHEMGTAKSIKSYYVDAGINAIDADNESKAARHGIRDLLKKHKLMVTSNCINTIREFNTHKWHPKKPDEVIKLDDDLLDAIKYVCNYQPSFKIQPEKIILKNTPEDNKIRTQQYLTHIFTEANQEEPEESPVWGL